MSHILFEKPHSLSYQAEIFHIFFPTTFLSVVSIIDGSLTNVIGKNMGKISAWYDNEWGFSNRMCDIAGHLHKIS